MKKLMATAALAAFCAAAEGATASYAELADAKALPGLTNKVDVTAQVEISGMELTHLKVLDFAKILAFCKAHPEAKADIDALCSKFANDDALFYKLWRDGGFDMFSEFPLLTSNKLASVRAAGQPVTAQMMAKNRNFDKCKGLPFADMVTVLNSEDKFDMSFINAFCDAAKADAAKTVKRWYRASGKSFVVRKLADGTVYNPMTAPLAELSAALNAARFEGLAAWYAKYGTPMQGELTLGSVPSGDALRAIMDDVLVDDKKFDDYAPVLRIALGVEGFNAFVKLYNEGEPQAE